VVKLPGPERQQEWTRSQVSPLDHNPDEAGNGRHAGLNSAFAAMTVRW
jgi:hypothetical protein